MSQHQSHPSYPSHPTFINLPQPPSNTETPPEVPGTPTSTTTSLSALSTTAIKDGHRGALHHRGHQQNASVNSLEAERADRISRLTGLSNVSTLRGPAGPFAHNNSGSPQTTPTSTGFPANFTGPGAMAGLTPAYFDAAGQPVADTKVSTVGSASATESVGGRTSGTTEVGGDGSTLGEDRDEDMLTEMDSASANGYMGGDGMDEDLDNMTSRSVGTFEDRMSDDGSASLVGFGEGAGSTLSGPIYHRRPLPTQNSTSSSGGLAWGLERSGSGLSDGPAASPGPHHYPHPHTYHVQHQRGGSSSRQRDYSTRSSDRDTTGSDTPVSQSAVRERREARMVDGVAMETGAPASGGVPMGQGNGDEDDVFVDTTTRSPVPVQPHTSTGSNPGQQPQQPYPRTRSRQQQQQQHHHQYPQQHPYSFAHHHNQQHQYQQPPPLSQQQPQHQYQQQHSTQPSTRETAERIVRETLDEGEERVGSTTLGSPRGNGKLGRFYFEES